MCENKQSVIYRMQLSKLRFTHPFHCQVASAHAFGAFVQSEQQHQLAVVSSFVVARLALHRNALQHALHPYTNTAHPVAAANKQFEAPVLTVQAPHGCSVATNSKGSSENGSTGSIAHRKRSMGRQIEFRQHTKIQPQAAAHMQQGRWSARRKEAYAHRARPCLALGGNLRISRSTGLAGGN